MLKVSGLHQYYGGSHILRGLDFEARLGEVTVVLGRNGVGKTTLLKSLMGVVPVKTGSIVLDGADITKMPPYGRARLGLGYVPQGRGIFPALSALDNLRFAYRGDADGQDEAIAAILKDFPRLEPLLDRQAGLLSGGEQQILALARCLIAEPHMLLLDEPTEGIQPSIIKDIGNAIKYLRDRGDIAILLVEQYFDFAAELADTFAVMERGQFILSGDRAMMQSTDVRQRLSL